MDPFPPSGATARAWCTKTTAGTVAGCVLLESSSGNVSWTLDFLHQRRFEPTLDQGVPVEVSMIVNLTLERGPDPPRR